MNDSVLFNSIIGPRISEKSLALSESKNRYVFVVSTRATKPVIKVAIENFFEVKVDSVQVLNVRGKRKTFARRNGRRANWKKAYVRLADGYSLDATVE